MTKKSAIKKSATKKKRKFVSALARGLDVLRAFQPNSGPLGNHEIAEFTGLPKPTVSRLTYTLTEIGYLNHIARLGKYELGTPVLALGYAALSNMQVRQLAHSRMQELANHSDTSVALAVRDRLSMLYVHNCVGHSTLALRIETGSRVPIAMTSLGRAMLAVLPDAERDYLMDAIKARNKDDWSKLKRRIETCIRQVNKRGFCLVDREWRPHVRAVGVPLIFPGNSGIMAINCAAPSVKISIEQFEDDLGPRLVHLAREVESMMMRP